MHRLQLFYVRYSGLVLFFGFFLAATLLGKILMTPTMAMKKVISVAALLTATTGWVLFSISYSEMKSWRRVLFIVGATALTIETSFTALGNFITGQSLLDHHWLDYAFMYERGLGFVLQCLAIALTFLGKGASRLVFIAALALICIVW